MSVSIKKNPHHKGQSLVEFAIALTLIMTLVAGAFDLGSAFFSYIAIRDAAQEGALFGSIKAATVVLVNGIDDGVLNNGEGLNTNEIINRVRESSTQPVNLKDITNVTVGVSLTPSVPNTDPLACAGNWISVTVTYNYQVKMPLIGTIIGSQTIPITAHVTNTILKPACP
jgi:Flp pilus assembly protein TadG